MINNNKNSILFNTKKELIQRLQEILKEIENYENDYYTYVKLRNIIFELDKNIIELIIY